MMIITIYWMESKSNPQSNLVDYIRARGDITLLVVEEEEVLCGCHVVY